jgi:hypothetical protein
LNKKIIIISVLLAFFQISWAQTNIAKEVKDFLRKETLRKAESVLSLKPITVTADFCERSAGGKHDFYSEGDYWWPNPTDLNGPYIQKDGQTNPENFVKHRLAMIRFSQISGLLASAYILTKNEKYAKIAKKHMKAWFVDTATYMNPSLLYAQAIKGRNTGRGIGIIDMIQMMEVARAAMIFEKSKSFAEKDTQKIKLWFKDYLKWVTTHQYGIDEREAKNNHGTCWVMQVSVFSQLVGDQKLLEYCENRFNTVLLPNQLKEDGSFPLELARTKPYGYSLFNLDAMSTLCHIFKNSLWDFKLPSGADIAKSIAFMYPFVKDKSTWKLPQDVMYWKEWPVAHPFLIFGAIKYQRTDWLNTWKGLSHFPSNQEVIRNLPVRNPIIWL